MTARRQVVSSSSSSSSSLLLQPHPPPPVAAAATSVVIAAGHSKNLATMSAIRAWCVQEKYGLRDFVKVRAFVFFLPERGRTRCVRGFGPCYRPCHFIVRTNEHVMRDYNYVIYIFYYHHFVFLLCLFVLHARTHKHHIKKNTLITYIHFFL